MRGLYAVVGMLVVAGCSPRVISVYTPDDPSSVANPATEGLAPATTPPPVLLSRDGETTAAPSPPDLAGTWEGTGKYKGKPFAEIINIAINDTLGRTILTSGTTALSLIGLLIFGVGEIRDFAWAMLIGIIVGTYSTIYIASPLTIWLDEREAARQAREKARMNQPKTA